MITYLIKSGLLLFVFYSIYKLILENEKMFRFNRAYLLGSLIFSSTIPLQLFTVESSYPGKINMVPLEGIVIKTNNTLLSKIDYNEIVVSILSTIYIVVALTLAFRFVMNLYSFYKKMTKNDIQFINGLKVVLVKEEILPHSFWNAIFINENELKNGAIRPELITHEKAHLHQKHTLDILFIEILQILFWFNPIIILFKKAIKLNHEFLADEAVNIQFKSVSKYQSLLLNIASNKSSIALASNINYLITKKRLLMMTKKESPIKIILKICSVGTISVLLFFTFNTKVIAQEISKKTDPIDKDVYPLSAIDTKPEFPGGLMAFYKFVGTTFKMPTEAAKNKIKGKAYMQFIIEKDGTLSEYKTIKDVGYGVGDEAIRVLKMSPKWTPGTIQGKPVRVMYSMPITIQSAE